MILEKSVDKSIKTVEYYGSPEVIKIGKFDMNLVKKVERKVNKIHNIGQPVIPLVIDSHGGNARSLLSVLETVNSSDRKVLTYVKGEALSCGFLLLGFGDEGLRYASPFSCGMIHELTWGKRDKLSEAESMVEHGRYENNTLYRRLAHHCGYEDKDYFLDLMYENRNSDNWLTPEDILKHHVVDKIGTPKLKFNVEINFEVEEEEGTSIENI